MAVFHSGGPMVMTPDELRDCAIFNNPTVFYDSAGHAISHKSTDPYTQKKFTIKYKLLLLQNCDAMNIDFNLQK